MTGREVIATVAGVDADRIAMAIEELGFVCVPKKPTKDMLDAAYWEALAENAEGVWDAMVATADSVTITGGESLEP